MDLDWPTVAQERKEQRVRAGVTQHRLAALIGVRESTLMRWENGKGAPSRLGERAWVAELDKLTVA